MSVDLHCHTKLSNSSMGIDDLIMLAKKRGVDTISITDHDCQAGSVRGRIIAARRGVTVVPGVELSASDAETGRQVHILGYFCDSPDRLEELCHKNNAARKKAGQYMILKAAQRYPISAELVMKCAAGSTGIFEEHIMHALVECGITQDFHGDIYNELFSPDSPKNIIVEPKFVGVKEVIDAIHGAGGIAVLAHPYKYNSVPGLDRYVEYGIDGIEGAADAYRLISEAWTFVQNVFPYKRVFTKYELALVSNCINIQLQGGFVKKNYLELLEPFREATDNKGKQLLETLETFVLDAGMNSAKTSEFMGIHTNTVQYRLKKINEVLDVEITGNRVIPGLTIALALKRLEKVVH